MWNYVFIFASALVALTIAQNSGNGPYIWDLQPVPMDAAEVVSMLSHAVPGETFPAFNTIPNTTFNCTQQKQPGYYADQEAGCQVIRRCPLNGGMVSYLCPNFTLFNQLTLVCDWWFNVDCSKAKQFYDFANPRIYNQKAKLHDTPPKNYIAPYFLKIQKQQRAQLGIMLQQLDVMKKVQLKQLHAMGKQMQGGGGQQQPMMMMMMGQESGDQQQSGEGMMMNQQGEQQMQGGKQMQASSTESSDSMGQEPTTTEKMMNAQGEQQMPGAEKMQAGSESGTQSQGEQQQGNQMQAGGEQMEASTTESSAASMGQESAAGGQMMGAQGSEEQGQQNDAPQAAAKGMAGKSMGKQSASQKMMMSNMEMEKKKKKRALH